MDLTERILPCDNRFPKDERKSCLSERMFFCGNQLFPSFSLSCCCWLPQERGGVVSSLSAHQVARCTVALPRTWWAMQRRTLVAANLEKLRILGVAAPARAHIFPFTHLFLSQMWARSWFCFNQMKGILHHPILYGAPFCVYVIFQLVKFLSNPWHLQFDCFKGWWLDQTTRT